MHSGFSLSKIIESLNKTLNFANQVIPLYVKARPLVNNASQILGNAKDLILKKYPKTQTETLKEKKENSSSSGRPVFFH